MVHAILWLGTLGALYLFFLFTTPVKAPPPTKLPTLEEIIALTPKKGDAKKEATEAPSEPAAPKKSQYEEIMAIEMEPANIERGKEVYLSQCIKCHNKDPNVKGPIGPEMVDAPLEVMKYKVATGRYPDVLPEGFVPKRKTKQMTKLPQYVKDVASLHAYVQSLKK